MPNRIVAGLGKMVLHGCDSATGKTLLGRIIALRYQQAILQMLRSGQPLRSEHGSDRQGNTRIWYRENTVGPSVFRQGERTRIHHHNMNSFLLWRRMIGFFAVFVFEEENPCTLIL
jgi:hypothetical protein